MKKIFTLAAAVLASFSLWAADPAFPTACLELPTSAAEMNSLSFNGSSYTNKYYLSATADTLILNHYLMSQSSVSNSKSIAWITYSDKGSSAANWNAAFGFKGTNYWGVNSQGNVRSDRTAWYRIKGASKFIGLYNQSGSSKKCIVSAYEITYSGETPSKSSTAAVTRTKQSSSDDTIQVVLDSSKEYIIEITGSSTSGYRMPEIMFIAPVCNSPEKALSISSNAPATLYAGTEVTLSIDGGNGATPTVQLDGAAFEGTTWTAVAGEHTFTVSQAANNGYCAQEDVLVLNVLAAEKVETVTISGSTAAYVGAELTYTANATNASEYEWYLDGDKQGSDSAKFIYTAVKGNHVIYCKARNQFNKDGETETWIKSNEINLAVTKVCGELIAFTAETGSGNIDKNITATGVVGGTAHQKTDKNGKIGSNGYYVSLTLVNGSFMAGDTVRVVSSTTYAKLHLFSDQGTNSIAEKATPANNDYVILDKGATTIYLYRNSTDGSDMNPTVVSMSVTRPCEESDNADLAELTINGEAVEAVENVYSYTVAATVDLAQVAVAFSIAHPLASADKESPFNITVPEGGAAANTATITVTAENGDQVTYTVSVTKAAAASTDATLKSLKIDGVDVVDFAADKLTYGKEYEYDYALVPVISAEANDAQATVEIDQTEAVPGVATITVTAEDEETKQVYTVNLAKEAVAPIIRATSTGNTTATVSGTIGGSYEKSTQGNKFGGKGNYWGLTLDGESTFQTGDTLHVIISQAAQQGTIALYEDKDGVTLIYNTEALGVEGDNVFVFPAAMNGKKTFYICRTETNSWNAFVSSICVKRKPAATAIGNTEAAVKAVKVIRDGQVLIIREGKTFNVMGAEVK